MTGRQFAAHTLVQANTEDLADPIGRQSPEADLTASLENLVDGEVVSRAE
jgi:hypothetical protein